MLTATTVQRSHVIANKDRDDRHRLAYELAFAKRPASEYYDVNKDPEQLTNVFRQSYYGAARQIVAEFHAVRA